MHARAYLTTSMVRFGDVASSTQQKDLIVPLLLWLGLGHK